MLNKILFQALTIACLFAGIPSLYADSPSEQAEEDKKVYRKFHPDGVVEFTDQPSRGSEELKMEELPTYKFGPTVTSPKSGPAAQDITPRPTVKLKPKAMPAPDVPYTSLSINSPVRNETIRANSGDIDVKFTLQPGLQFYKGHKIEYLLDGKSVLKTEQPQILKNVERGGHSLVIQVVDKNNKVLIHSDSVTFNVKRYFKPRSQTPPAQPKAPDFDAGYDT